MILYTSGTTGSPKGAELTHSNMLRNCQVVDRVGDRRQRGRPAARRAAAVPLVRSDLRDERVDQRARAVSLIPRFDPVKALEILERDKITIFEGVPTMYNALLAVPDRDRYDTSSLRVCVSGGASMPVEMLRELRRGVRLQDARGLRAVGDLAGRLVQPPATASASRARSARRSRASR